MQALGVHRQAHQVPLAPHLRQAAQAEAPEAQHVLDPAVRRLRSRFHPIHSRNVRDGQDTPTGVRAHARAGRERSGGAGPGPQPGYPWTGTHEGSARDPRGIVRRVSGYSGSVSVNARIDNAVRELRTDIAGVNTRIDNVLLADRGGRDRGAA